MPQAKRTKRLVVPLTEAEQADLTGSLPAGVKKAEFVRRLIRGWLAKGRTGIDGDADDGLPSRDEAIKLLAARARDGHVQATVALERALRADDAGNGSEKDDLGKILGS